MDYAVPDYAQSFSDSYVTHDVFVSDYNYDDYDYSKCGGSILLDAGYKKMDSRQREELCRGFKPSGKRIEISDEKPLPPYPTFADNTRKDMVYRKQGFFDSKYNTNPDTLIIVVLFVLLVYLIIMCVSKTVEVACLKRMLSMQLHMNSKSMLV